MKIAIICFAALAATSMALPQPEAEPFFPVTPTPFPDFKFNGMTISDMWKLGKDALERINDLPKYSFDIMRSIPDEIKNSVPNAMNFLAMGSRELAAAPVKEISKVLNSLCNAGVASNSARPRLSPKMEEMKYILATKDNNNITYALTNPEALVNNPHFNKNWGITLIITGWNSDVQRGGNYALDTLVNAYRCRGNTNILIIDTARFIDTLYLWSSFNTEEVGNEIAKALILLKKHWTAPYIHLIGHSLGGQIVGSTGRNYYQKTNDLIEKCTALDPALVCFNEGETLTNVARGDCGFVEVIHTNGGVLGTKEASGDVDFYPNGNNPFQPGCMDLVCSHNRAFEYFAETVYPGNEMNFLSVRCNSLLNVQNNRCNGAKIPMGIATPKSVKGNYFFETNSAAPFGKDNNRIHNADKPRCNI